MYWLAIGPSKNWEVTLQGEKIWGVVPRYQAYWNQAEEGDTILFYATTPIKGFIGYGKIRSKRREGTPLWSQEVETKKALWPLRFKLDVEFYLNPEQWETKRIPVSKGQLFLAKGFQPLKDDLAKNVIEALLANS